MGQFQMKGKEETCSFWWGSMISGYVAFRVQLSLGLRIHIWWPTMVSACFCFSHFASCSEFWRGILQEMAVGDQKLFHASETDSE